MSTGLPDWANGSMALDNTPDTSAPTSPAGGLPGTGSTAVASGAGPDLQIANTEAVTTGTDVALQPDPYVRTFTPVESQLPESTRGDIERADDIVSNSPNAGDRRQSTY